VVRALVLLSGGIDSTTALYLTKQQTDDIYSMNIIYAQSYDSEAAASRKIAAAAHVREHLTIFLPFFKDIERRYRPTLSSRTSSAYIPARNIVFYGVAAAYAETLKVNKIIFGSNADDAKEFPDARLRFIQLMNELIRDGTRAGKEGFVIETVNPLINYNKTEVLKLAIALKVPLQLTWSCYEDSALPCGRCRGCISRQAAFNKLGIQDPLLSSSKSGNVIRRRRLRRPHTKQ
jgi:7-cyano-7-deazaguanine synthase